jgi:phage-related minor tail protein
MPLQRGADGKLGIAGGGGSVTHYHNWTINTPDANSFRNSQRQVESSAAATLQRASMRNAQ